MTDDPVNVAAALTEPQAKLPIDQIDRSLPINDAKQIMIDAGRRRHLSWGMDFDSRAANYADPISEDWEDEVKELHRQNRASFERSLIAEFGEHTAVAKLENFLAIDTKPMSVLAYHNALYHQIRQSFVIGAYYPALVGACALGERILNHLMIDMRPYFTATPEFKRVYRKASFDDWTLMIDTLETWGILLPDAVSAFRALMPLRHRSIHFNTDTYASLRDDALSAVLQMRQVIEQQFGSFAARPWFISGTLGHVFIRKAWETNPFVQTYFLAHCPFVGPMFSMRLGPQGWEFFDESNYGPGEMSDEEFAKAYNERDPEQVVQPSDV